jgi:NitT/TauT family transport system ATP-binding protein
VSGGAVSLAPVAPDGHETAGVPIISIRHAAKTYANGVVAVQGLSLDVGAGEFLSLLGPSGCGKSTVLRLVAGLGDLSDGTIAWHG